MDVRDVTVVCAVFNAREAVRLTFESFFRYNPPGARVFVADNGSTDGALEELRRFAQLQLVTLEQRTALLARARAQRQVEREESVLPVDSLDPGSVGLAEHGATLDWLVERVATPLVLVMDSDVEFLEHDCLPAMVDLLERDRLAALGPYEPGFHGYQPRLAPNLLLLRTEVVRQLHVSFRGDTLVSDPHERERWEQRGLAFEAVPSELAQYHSLRVYPTAARLFEALVGQPWSDLPDYIGRRYRHFGHMSWGPLTDVAGGSTGSRARTTSSAALIAKALRAYTADAP
jgi:hypothetical protein